MANRVHFKTHLLLCSPFSPSKFSRCRIYTISPSHWVWQVKLNLNEPKPKRSNWILGKSFSDSKSKRIPTLLVIYKTDWSAAVMTVDFFLRVAGIIRWIDYLVEDPLLIKCNTIQVKAWVKSFSHSYLLDSLHKSRAFGTPAKLLVNHRFWWGNINWACNTCNNQYLTEWFKIFCVIFKYL